MARAAVEDPLKSFRFRVVIDGFVRAGFSEVTGFDRETDEAKYREGGFNETEQKSAGLTHFGDIMLKRGLIIGSSRGGDTDMLDWADLVFDIAVQGNAGNYRKDLDIEQYSAQNTRARVWRVYDSWPKKVVPTGELKAESSENLYESITLANEGWEMVNSST